MLTIRKALINEVHYPINNYVENVLIKRGLEGDAEFTREVSFSDAYMGAVADCLYSLIQAVNISEADKSIGTLSDKDKERILFRANKIYGAIGESLVDIDNKPIVYIGLD